MGHIDREKRHDNPKCLRFWVKENLEPRWLHYATYNATIMTLLYYDVTQWWFHYIMTSHNDDFIKL